MPEFNDVFEDLYYATNNNLYGYMHLSTVGMLREKNGRLYFSTPEVGDISLEERPVGKDLLNQVLPGEIVSHGDDIFLIFTDKPLEDKQILFSEIDEESQKGIETSLVLDFLRRVNIDTIPKLNQILKDESQISLSLLGIEMEGIN